MFPLTLPFTILSTLAGQAEPVFPTLPEIQQAFAVIQRTNCFEPTEERLRSLNVLKAAADRLAPMDYVNFYGKGTSATLEQLRQAYENLPILYAYDRAFDTVLDGVKNETVKPGTVVCWHVYNMGYVFKTTDCVFAIDLHHRRSAELIPYLDFVAVTHNHSDHLTNVFLARMNNAHKPVLTNFFANDGYPATDDNAGYSRELHRTLTIKGLTIHTYASDHNAKLRKFVQPIEIICGQGPDAVVIYSSGDSCNPAQLAITSDHLDAWLVHPYVGLHIEEGARRLRPRLTLVSHLEEFHHRLDQWRWTWRQGYDTAQKVWDENLDAVVPLWGDKINLGK